MSDIQQSINFSDLPTITLNKLNKDLTNHQQGSLTFLLPAERINGRIYWWVQCECGTIEKIRSDNKKICCNQCSMNQKRKKLKGKTAVNLTGQRFGRLVALYPLEERKNNKIIWHCHCDCGQECEVCSAYLLNGSTKSCGCLKKENAKIMGMNNAKDLTYWRFGYLVALHPTKQRLSNGIIWECQCDCGNKHFASASDLIRGKIKSCGCQRYNKEMLIKDIIGQRFGKLVVFSRDDKDSDGSYNYLCQCDCGVIKKINGVSLRCGITTSCGCITYSIGERKISAILQQNNIEYIKEWVAPDLKNRRFDFYLPQNNRLIEFDGRQHYQPYPNKWEKNCNLQTRQQRDNEKNQYALSHNIPLARIPYWERDNINLEMILGDKYLIH